MSLKGNNFLKLLDFTPAEISEFLELAAELKGHECAPLLVGDGAKLTYDYLTNEGIACRMAPANLLYQSAWGVGMAALGKEAGGADDLLPVYLRLSQAERERQERLGR